MKKLIFICFIFISANTFAQRGFYRHGFRNGIVLKPRIVMNSQKILIADEWELRNGRYVLVPGYYATPRYGYTRWIPGHWKNGRRRIWVSGHWV